MSRTANTVLLGVILLLLGFGLLLQFLPSGVERVRASVFSEEKSGRMFAFELLRELGFETRAWTQSPGRLPHLPALALLHEVPETPPGYLMAGNEPGAEATSPGPRASSRRLRDPLHYLRFVEEGGVILLPLGEDTLVFLRATLDLVDFDEVASIELVRDEDAEDELSPVLFRDGSTLAVSWSPTRTFVLPPLSSALEVVLADDIGRPLALRAGYGRGAVVLIVSEDDFLENGSLVEPGNAQLLARLVEEHAPENPDGGRTILFDEYVLGGWTPDSPVELAFTAVNFPFSLHLLLWGFFALWVAAWAREFPRDPVVWSPVSAVVRARGFAGVLARAGRWDLLARMLRAGVLRRLAGRAGVREWTAETGLEPLDPTATAALLGPLFPRAGDPDLERARRLFDESSTGVPVKDREELESLGAALAALERRAHAQADTKQERGSETDGT